MIQFFKKKAVGRVSNGYTLAYASSRARIVNAFRKGRNAIKSAFKQLKDTHPSDLSTFSSELDNFAIPWPNLESAEFDPPALWNSVLENVAASQDHQITHRRSFQSVSTPVSRVIHEHCPLENQSILVRATSQDESSEKGDFGVNYHSGSTSQANVPKDGLDSDCFVDISLDSTNHSQASLHSIEVVLAESSVDVSSNTEFGGSSAAVFHSTQDSDVESQCSNDLEVNAPMGIAPLRPKASQYQLPSLKVDDLQDSLELDIEEVSEPGLISGIHYMSLTTYLDLLKQLKEKHDCEIKGLKDCIEKLENHATRRSCKIVELEKQVTRLLDDLSLAQSQKRQVQTTWISSLKTINGNAEAQVVFQESLLGAAQRTFKDFRVHEETILPTLQHDISFLMNLVRTPEIQSDTLEAIDHHLFLLHQKIRLVENLCQGKTYLARKNCEMIATDFEKIRNSQQEEIEDLNSQVIEYKSKYETLKEHIDLEKGILTATQNQILDIQENMFKFFLSDQNRQCPKAANNLADAMRDTIPKIMKLAEGANFQACKYHQCIADHKSCSDQLIIHGRKLQSEIQNYQLRIEDLESDLHDKDRHINLIVQALENLCSTLLQQERIYKDTDIARLIWALRECWIDQATKLAQDVTHKQMKKAEIEKDIGRLIGDKTFWQEQEEPVTIFDRQDREIIVQRRLIEALIQEMGDSLGIRAFVRNKYEELLRAEVEAQTTPPIEDNFVEQGWEWKKEEEFRLVE